MKIDLISNDIQYIMQTDINNFDDNYILPSLKTLLNRIKIINQRYNQDNQDSKCITIYLVSKNSGTITQLRKGYYKYIQIKFYGNEYKEIGEHKYENNILNFADKNKLCFFEIGAFLDLFNVLKSLEQKQCYDFFIYNIINSIIDRNKLLYFGKKYNNIVEAVIKKDEYITDLIIKERELKRLKKILQEYYDSNKSGILSSYRLQKCNDDNKKIMRYYTLESLIILDEILRIYKNIKEDTFNFIRNISYLEDTNDIKDELFDKIKVLKALKDSGFIKNNLYIESILEELNYNNKDKEFKDRIENIKNTELKKLFDSEDIENIKKLNNEEIKNYIEDYIFILFNNIKIMIDEYKNIKDDDKKTELENKIIDYDFHFLYFKFVLDYIFIVSDDMEVYNNLYDLYRYKYFYLKKDNIDFFETIYKKHSLENYKYPFDSYISFQGYYVYKNYYNKDKEEKYSISLKVGREDIVLLEDDYHYLYLYYDFLSFLLYYTIINNDHAITKFKVFPGSFKAEDTEDNLKILDYYSILSPDVLLKDVKDNIKKIKFISDVIYFSNIKKEHVKKLRDDIIELNKKIYYIDDIINNYDITDTLDYLFNDKYVNENKEMEKIKSVDFTFNKFRYWNYFGENILRMIEIFNFTAYKFYIDKTNFEMLYKYIDKILFSIEKVNILYKLYS